MWALHCGGFPCCRSGSLELAGFSSRGIQAQLPLGMWNLPRPGIEPVSLGLEGGFLTTGLPGKALYLFIFLVGFFFFFLSVWSL